MYITNSTFVVIKVERGAYLPRTKCELKSPRRYVAERRESTDRKEMKSQSRNRSEKYTTKFDIRSSESPCD